MLDAATCTLVSCPVIVKIERNIHPFVEVSVCDLSSYITI